MARKKKLDQNYLDFVPALNPAYEWYVDEDGIVRIQVVHKGFINRIAQRVFYAPEKSKLALDVFGSFVWQRINGSRTVYDIGELVKEEFGEDAEPLYPRLARFLQLLKNNGYIGIQEK